MAVTIGFDTSNYTTSVALFDGETGHNLGRLLNVPAGTLGLRQSDALFQHVKRLPELVHQLSEEGRLGHIDAVGVSTKPRWVEGSYMPCFLAGESQASVLADTLGVPCYPCSHQQGHIAAAAWSSGKVELLDTPHLAWHLSGGTTELLLVEPQGKHLEITCIGGTSDISAGQLIDRTGKYLGLNFPAGKAVDALARESVKDNHFAVKLQELTFSLSGIENQVKAQIEKGTPPADVARFVLCTLGDVLVRATKNAHKQWPNLPVLCSGGVASNTILRTMMADAIFAPPQYSTDNALGVAILAHRMHQGSDTV